MSTSASPRTLGTGIRLALAALLVTLVAACSGGGFFSKPVEPIIPADELYDDAVGHMEANRYVSAIEDLEKLERQHPYSDYNERAKVMITFANFRIGRFEEAALAADRFLALYPQSSEAPYILFLKGSSYFQQIPDATRDQTFAADTIDTFELLISSYPNSRYAEEAKPMMVIARDQLAAKEMSVGRYYLGHGDYAAAINRFRAVVEDHQQSTHVEEALYRLVEAYLSLGLIGEAQTAAAVLGTNYPSGEWYGRAFTLLQEKGLSPQMVEGNWLSS
ncbi:outer membrane protein assembly factor BamD [Pelagibacterium halotolerans]|uniref:outer membrane protein assembly factor BamD n=1 Tax=Pelagibacterium halotolerans TaxID=531813 RepID=UPI00384E980A